MKFPPRSLWAMILALTLIPLVAQEAGTNEGEKVAFVDSGLAKGDPTAVLPGGWIFAARIPQPDRSLARLDRLLAPFMSADFVPAGKDQASLLKAPITTALAQGGKFGPVTRANILARTGVDLGRPLYVAWYPNGGMPKSMSKLRKGLILAIPVSSDKELVGGFLTGLLDGEELQAEAAGVRKAVTMKSPLGTGASGRLAVLLTADYAYVCGSMTLAELLADGKSTFMSEPMARAFPTAREEDVFAAVGFGILNNPDTWNGEKLEGMFGGLVGQLSKSLAGMSATKRGDLARALRSFTGIASPEDGVTLVDALGRAALQELLPEVRRMAESTKGLSLTTTLNGDFGKSQWTLHRTESNAKALGATIPWESVRPALAAIPGDRDTVLIRGRAAEGTGPVLWSRMVDRMAALAQAKGVKWPFLTRLKETLAGWRHTPPMESRWSWAVSFQNARQAAPLSMKSNPSPMERQFATSLARFTEPWTTLFPGADRLAPERFLAERASNQTANEVALNRFFYDRLGAEWLTGSTRFRVAPPIGRAATLVSEDVTTLQLGLFGYQQHEWINREIYYLRPLGDYQLMQKSRLPSAWFSAEGALTALPVEPGFTRLLDLAPAEAHGVLIDRRLKQLLPLADDLAQLEKQLIAEAEAFLKKARQMVAAHTGDEVELRDKAALLDAPVFVTELLLDDEKQVSCKILGVPYPRPSFMEPITALLAGYRAQATGAGGAVYAYTENADRIELTATQDFLGLAQLVTSMARTIAQKYPGETFEKKLDAFGKSFAFEKKGLVSLAKYDGGLFGIDALESLFSKGTKKARRY